MLSALLKSLAELEAISSLYQHDATAWSAFLEKGEELYIDHVIEKNELVFSTNIPLEPIREREDFFKFLLKSNHAWCTQCFCFLAISEDEKHMTLIRAFSTNSLALPDLSAGFQEFYNQLELWKNYVINFSLHQNKEPITGLGFSPNDSHYIKV